MRADEAFTGRTLFHARHRLRGREADLLSTALEKHCGHVFFGSLLELPPNPAALRKARLGPDAFRRVFSSHLPATGLAVPKPGSTAQPGTVATASTPATCRKAPAETGSHIGKSDHSAPTHNNAGPSQLREPERPAAAGRPFETNAILRSGWPADIAAAAPSPVGRTSATLPSERFACDHRQPVPL